MHHLKKTLQRTIHLINRKGCKQNKWKVTEQKEMMEKIGGNQGLNKSKT